MKTIKYDPLAGTHISEACTEAIALAKQSDCLVQLSFNGVSITASPDSTNLKLETEFYSELEAQSKAYRESPRGIAAAAKRARQIVASQNEINSLLVSLDEILSMPKQEPCQQRLMLWLKSFSSLADDVAVNFDKVKLASQLESAGFIANDYVGRGPELTTREPMARYIVGQAIACLHDDMPPHPVTARFVDDYFKLPSNP